MKPEEEQLLLGYLLGALEPEEEEQVAQKLQSDPHWQHQAARWQTVLNQLALVRSQVSPPRGLALRTWQLLQVPSSAPASVASGGFASRWSTLDLITATVVLAVLVLMVVPALSWQRFRSQVVHCSDNLRYLGQALQHYHAVHQHFPEVPASGPLAHPGVFASLLFENRLLDDPRRLLCQMSAQRARKLCLLTPQQLRQLSQQQCAQVLVQMAGDYGYCLGYLTAQGQYVPFRCQRDGLLPLMADAPDRALTGRPGRNHGPWGYNLLFANGQVRFVSTPYCQECDHIFLNHRGQVGPGCDRRDAVIAPGNADIRLAAE